MNAVNVCILGDFIHRNMRIYIKEEDASMRHAGNLFRLEEHITLPLCSLVKKSHRLRDNQLSQTTTDSPNTTVILFPHSLKAS